MPDYTKNESVLAHIPRIGEAARDVVQILARKYMKSDTQETESPIEAIFAMWWGALYPILDPERRVKLHAQFGFAPINGRKYRADFAIWPRDLDELSASGVTFNPVVIELDGHDYHERTKEQVIARNQRDRDFQTMKYRVLHFSGAELHREPDGVFVDVFHAAMAAYDDYTALCLASAERRANAGGPIHPPTTRTLGEGQPVDGPGIPNLDPIHAVGR